ncbi:MAG: hypothetical protein JST78_05590 [Bacteroidetes bacterium]|nr:hypothetical protein [Bacteroidota bacterium]
MKTKTIYLLLFVMLSSCSNDSKSDPETAPTVLLKKRTKTTNGVSTTETFTYDGNKLVSIETSTGLLRKFVYTNDLITRVAYTVVGGSLDTSLGETFQYNENSQLIKKTVNIFDSWSSSMISYYIDYIHNGNGTVSYTKYQNGTTTAADSGTIFIESDQLADVSNEYYYPGWGFVSHGGAVVYHSGGTKTKSTIYELDNQHNPLGNIIGFNKILFAGVLDFRGSPDHNMIKTRIFTTSIIDEDPANSYNPSSTSSLTWDYNTQGFPIHFLQRDSENVSQVYEETYFYE